MIYRRRDNVVCRRIAGETLLIPIRGNLVDMQRLFVLEGAGDFIWEMIDGSRTTDDIRKAITGHFDMAAQDAGADLDEFITELAQRELIAEAH